MWLPSTRPLVRHSQRAFSLVEIVVAMVVLSLLLGSVFGIVWQSVDTASEMQEYERRDQQMDRFLFLLNRAIETLPSGGSVQLTQAGESSSGQTELTISGSADAFIFDYDVATRDDLILSLRPQNENPYELPEPLYQIAISRESFAPSEDDGEMVFRASATDGIIDTDEDGRYWLPLISDVTAMTWRFWDAEQRDWVDTWEDNSEVPPMLELVVEDAWHPGPVRMVFEMPEHLTQAAQSASQNTSSNGTGSSDSRTAVGPGAIGPGGGRPSAGPGGPGGADGRGQGPRGGRGGRDGAGPGGGPGGPGGDRGPGGPGGGRGPGGGQTPGGGGQGPGGAGGGNNQGGGGGR